MKPAILALIAAVFVACVYGFCYCVQLTTWWSAATTFLCVIGGIISFGAGAITAVNWVDKNL